LLGKSPCFANGARRFYASLLTEREKTGADYFRASLPSTASLVMVWSTAPKASRWPMPATRSLSKR
jgi:hypothetical protein